jgi:hypothetical protein
MLAALLGTAAGTAAVTIGRGAAAALGNGLSFAGELAKAAGSTAVMPDVAAKGKGGLPVEFSQRISDLTERIRRYLSAAGVKLAQPVELVSDGLGGIAVAGAHPQQAAIEKVLEDDVLLERDFQRLAREYRDFVVQGNDAELPAGLAVVVN